MTSTSSKDRDGRVEDAGQRGVAALREVVFADHADPRPAEVAVEGGPGEGGVHAVRVADVRPGQHLEDRRAVLGAAGQRADVVQAVTQGDATGLGHSAEGGHQPGDAAEGGRDANAACGIGTQTGEEQPGGHAGAGDLVQPVGVVDGGLGECGRGDDPVAQCLRGVGQGQGRLGHCLDSWCDQGKGGAARKA
jgi:hypothetical protein